MIIDEEGWAPFYLTGGAAIAVSSYFGESGIGEFSGNCFENNRVKVQSQPNQDFGDNIACFAPTGVALPSIYQADVDLQNDWVDQGVMSGILNCQFPNTSLPPTPSGGESCELRNPHLLKN